MVSVTELWHTLEHAITSYTGLSPATFFTVLVVALAFYYLVSGFFQAPPPPRKREVELEKMEPLPPPVQLGEITEEELSVYDGADPKKPLLMAIKGQIYDVTQSRMFYGPGGPYALFAGKDASRALAKMSFEQKDLTGDISGLGPFELEALQDWEYKFMGKYVKVGTIKKTVPVTEGNTSETTEASTQTTEGAPAESPTEPIAESKEDTPTVAEPKEVSVAPAESPTEPSAESKEDTQAVAEPKEVTVAPAESPAEPSAESKEDTPAVAEPKEVSVAPAESPAEPSAESKDTPAVTEPKEVSVAEETKG